MSIDVGLEFVLNQLAEILKENYELVKHLDKNIEDLETELKLLRGLVKDFQKQDHRSDFVKTLVKQIKTLIWQSEDVVESFVLELAAYKASKPTAFSRIWAKWKKAGEVTEIIAKIKKIRTDYVPLAFKSEGSTGSSTRSSDRYFNEGLLVEENNVVGFEDAIKDVENIIYGGGNQLEIATIVGMLGLGKTTLANKVFKNPKIADEFVISAFVYVSKDYNIKDVFIKILRSITQVTDGLKHMRVQDLQSRVRKELQNTTYLIVLDDVWDTKAWEDLRDAFPMNSNVRCRVLITTRDENVATCANGDVDPYRLKFLTIEKSRELLCQRVFGTKSCPNQDLVASEVTIATNCSGLPLSIVVIAGILVNRKDDVEFWKEVATHGNSVEEDKAKIKQMTEVMEFMYRHLPDHLKLCFLYLGVFRHDSDIPVWKVVRLWIAEGLIQSRENVKSEDMKVEDWAEATLKQLVSRNLVIVVKKRANEEKIKSVRIHDALRDFCKDKAKEEGVFHEITDGKSGLGLYKLKSPLRDCRRLFINTGAGTEKFISSAKRFNFVRSFLTFSRDKISVEAKHVAKLPKSFEVLRVLEIQPLLFNLFPSKLKELTLLKYICISLVSQEIPASFSGMFHMQTLIVYTTSPTLKISADIWKMPSFRHLHTNKPTTLPSPKKDDKGGDDLQTLSQIAPLSCTHEVFDRVPNVRKLGIRGNLVDLSSTALDHLFHFKSLDTLKLHNDQSCQLTGFPSGDKFQHKLTKITLINTRLPWREMSKLGKLEILAVLKLKEHAFQGWVWKTRDGEFPRLKHLHIGCMDLTSWEVASPQHFPQLKTLIIDNCENLETLPSQVGAVPCLRSVSLHYTNAQLVASTRNLFQSSSITAELSIRG